MKNKIDINNPISSSRTPQEQIKNPIFEFQQKGINKDYENVNQNVLHYSPLNSKIKENKIARTIISFIPENPQSRFIPLFPFYPSMHQINK